MLAWLLENAIVGTTLALVVCLICRALRPRPALRHALWLVVLLKLVTPPVVHWPWSLELGALAELSRPADAPVPAPRARAASTPRGVEPARLGPHGADGRGTAGLGGIPPTDAATNPAPGATSAPRAEAAGGLRGRVSSVAPTLLRALSLVWILGVLAALARELARWRRLARALAEHTPPPSRLADELRASADALGLTAPETRVVRALDGPFIYGLWRARLYWPAQLEDGLDAAGLRGVVTHELAHVERRDHLVAWVELGAALLFWWLPLVPWVRRRLREAAEWACDAQVIRSWPELRRDYAQALVEVAIARSRRTPIPALGMTRGRSHEFESRVRQILHASAPPGAPRAGLCAVLVLGVCALPAWSSSGDPVGSARDASDERAPGPPANAASGAPPLLAPGLDTPPPRTGDVPGLVEFEASARVLVESLYGGLPGQGVALALVRGREVLFLRTLGSLQVDTPHPIGTVSGVLTATRLAALRDAGRVGFDDPLLAHIGSPEALADARLAQITLRHLLLHTSGLPAQPELDFTDRRSLHAGLARVRLTSAPGVEYAPSRAGYALLGRVVEEAGGEPFGEGLERGVLRPLGMSRTVFDERDAASGAERLAADGLLSTAGDLARLLSFQLLAAPLHGPLAPRTVIELQEPRHIHTHWLQPRSLAWMQDWAEEPSLFHYRASRIDGATTFVAFSSVHKVGIVFLGQGVADLSEPGRHMMRVAARNLSDTRAASEAFEAQRFEQAFQAFSRLHERYPWDVTCATNLGFLALATEREELAEEPLLAAWSSGRARAAVPYNLACTHARLGDAERALEWLRIALERGFRSESLLQNDPDLALLRGNEHFESLAVEDY